ncbi:hypothetical protein ALP82_200177 [Pseudomonas savastanoi pv. fraxini]|nr:hypothetical protein ALQ90_200103 [Pseudomonas savastanoi pv. savastanoi]RMR64862.1 hypothetical protein ALP82_200177 [Pseudomonas savastanoi pv. fraxini]RMR69431.1 hypothetical protein ALP80_200028 [Pseudomonas savastanoi pv. fraxini]
MHGAHRHHKTHAISRSHIAAAPSAGQCDAVLCGYQDGIAGGQGVITHVVLINPQQSVPPQCWCVLAYKRFGASVAGFGQEHRAQTGV